MEVKLIGTGGIFSPYNSACALIDKHILIDVPNGSIKQIRKANLKATDIDYVFITHFHADHFFDIPFLLLEKSKHSNNKLTIVASKKAMKTIADLTKLAFPDAYQDIFKNVKLRHLINNKKIKIKDYEIDSLKMQHGIETYGYIFKDKNQKIGFTGDTGECENLHLMCKACNKVVIDATLEVGNEKHLGVNDILMLLKEYPETEFIPTHTSPKEKRLLSFQSFDNLNLLNDFDEVLTSTNNEVN